MGVARSFSITSRRSLACPVRRSRTPCARLSATGSCVLKSGGSRRGATPPTSSRSRRASGMRGCGCADGGRGQIRASHAYTRIIRARPRSGSGLRLPKSRGPERAQLGEIRTDGGKPASGHVPHGFRSTFRDWAGECTAYPRELAEAALAHTVGDQTERAYWRGDALARRRELMEAWAGCMATVGETRTIVPIRRATAS
jgi:hypothetical protein